MQEVKSRAGGSGAGFFLQPTDGGAWPWEAGQVHLLWSLRVPRGLPISHGGLNNMALTCPVPITTRVQSWKSEV